MKLQGIGVNPSLLQIDSIKPALKLESGQILDARIEAKLSQNLFKLLINNQTVIAKSKQPFSIGQELRLVVEKAEKPIVLKSFTAPDKTIDNVLERQQLSTSRRNLLRQTVPKQTSLQPLVKTLTQFLQKADVQAPMPARLTETIQQLLDTFTSSDKVTTKDGFKQAVKASGLFLEAQLVNNDSANKASNTPSDIKASLLKISALLNSQVEQTSTQGKQTQVNNPAKEAPGPAIRIETPSLKSSTNLNELKIDNAGLKQTINHVVNKTIQHTPTTNNLAASDLDSLPDARELNRQVEQSLNKIQLNQNNAVVIEKNEIPTWTMDIPVKNGKQIDILNVSIYKDGSRSDSDNQGLWNIQLKFDFEPLGEIFAKVSLYNQEIMTSLWAEKTETREMIKVHLHELETDLAKKGLDVGCVQCLAGKVPEPETIIAEKSLVDVHL